MSMRRIEVSELLADRDCRIPGCENILDKTDPTLGRHAFMCSPCRRGETGAVIGYYVGRGETPPGHRAVIAPLPPRGPRPHGMLSAREKRVLSEVADGYRNEEIAARLGVTVETVKTHVRHILDKLGAHNRAEAVAIGFRRGILGLQSR